MVYGYRLQACRLLFAQISMNVAQFKTKFKEEGNMGNYPFISTKIISI